MLQHEVWYRMELPRIYLRVPSLRRRQNRQNLWFYHHSFSHSLLLSIDSVTIDLLCLFQIHHEHLDIQEHLPFDKPGEVDEIVEVIPQGKPLLHLQDMI